VHLRGEDLQFTVNDPLAKARYEFAGHVGSAQITGTVRIASTTAQRQLEWDASRTEPGAPAHAALKKPVLQELQLVQ